MILPYRQEARRERELELELLLVAVAIIRAELDALLEEPVVGGLPQQRQRGEKQNHRGDTSHLILTAPPVTSREPFRVVAPVAGDSYSLWIGLPRCDRKSER